jgi:acyl-CoA thioesterase FadM
MDAGANLTLRSKFKVKGHQQWYATHRLEVVSLHAKHEKSVLNDKKVTARTQFVMDARTSLTLRSKFKVKGHQQWYATHRLEVVYLHAKYAKPVLNDKKVTARTRFVMDGGTDRLITIGHPPQSGRALIKTNLRGIRIRFLGGFVCLFVYRVLNATFSNISVISWRSVLLVKETEVHGENHRPVASHCQTLAHKVVSSTHCLSGI